MALDIYSVRSQLAALEVLPPVYTFLHDMLCRDGGCVEENKAIYDFKKGTIRMAPVVHEGTGGVVMSRDSYETNEIDFCTIAPERVVESKHLQSRMFGEKVLGAMTAEQRSKKLQAKDLMEMRSAIASRIEWMVRQIALTGKLEVFSYTDEGRNKKATLQADFGFQNHITPATKWNESDARIEYDMMQIFDKVYDEGGLVDICIVAPDVAAAMIENGNYIKHLDARNVDIGEMNVKYRGKGVRFLGHDINGVEMYALSGKFIDDNGTAQPIIPGGTLIAGSKGMFMDVYGPVTQVEKDGIDGDHMTYVKKEVPLRYASVNDNAVKNRLTSRPMILPENPNGWAVAKVL